MRRVLNIVLLLGLAAGAFSFLRCRGEGGGERETSRIALQEAILERKVKGVEAMLAAARKGRIVPFDEVLVTVDQKLIQELLDSATPYEQVVGDKYRIRLESTDVRFSSGFALVQLNGRASLAGRDEQTVYADVEVYGVLEITGLDPSTGTLRARVNVIGFDVPQVGVMGIAAPVRRLVESLAGTPIEKFNVLASDIEIPVALERDVTIPAVGPEGEVKIAAATIPLHVGIRDVTVMGGKIFVAIGVAVKGEGTEKQAPDSARLKGPEGRSVRQASRVVGSDSIPGKADLTGRDGAAPDSMSPRMKSLEARYDTLLDSLIVVTKPDTLLWAVVTDSGDVAVGLKPELIDALVREATTRYLSRVELDLPLEEEVEEGEQVKVKVLFGKRVTAGNWKVHVTVHRVQAVLRAKPPQVSVAGENRLRVTIPVQAESGHGSATVAFAWDAKGVASVACGDFQTKLDVEGDAVPREYTVTGDFLIAAQGDRIVLRPEFPVQKIRISVSPSEATWRKVRTTMSALDKLDKCGIGMQFLSSDKVVALLQGVLTKGFDVKLPTKIVPTLDFPASVSESVEVEGREVKLAVRPRLLRVTPQAFWYSANVDAGLGEIQPESRPAAEETRSRAGKGAS